LALRTNALNQTVVTWTWQPRSERDEVSRGSIVQLAAGSYGRCQTASDPDLSDGLFIDGEPPAAGSSYSYRVQGVDTGRGGPASLGADSGGSERVNSDKDAPSLTANSLLAVSFSA
jgi:hypothetical protein